MDAVKGIASLLIILSILVVVHEWGHFIVAKLFKMRVEEFSLFFGKVALRLGVRHGTVYNIRTLPFGGFVRIAGMEADDISGGRPILEAIRDPLFNDPNSMERVLQDLERGSAAGIDTSKVTDEVRKKIQWSIGPDNKLTKGGFEDLVALQKSPVLTADESRLIDLVLQAHSRATDPALYNQRPIYQRALVIFAGPFMSLFFGYFVYCLMGMTIGLQDLDRPLTNQIAILQEEHGKKMPARTAGLVTGDRIVAIDGQATPDGTSVVEKIHKSIGVPLHLAIKREGQILEKTIVPTSAEQKVEKKGRVVTEKVGRIGITLIPVYRRYSPMDSIKAGTLNTYGYIRNLIAMIFTDPRGSLGGPLAMGQMATAAQRLGVAHLFELGAIFSLSLGIMNLLPIPILDGGHLLLLAWEKVRGQKLSPMEVYRAQMVGLGVLALLVAFVFYNDILRWVHGQAIQ